MIILIIFVVVSIPELNSYRRYKHLNVNCELLNFRLGEHRLITHLDCCLTLLRTRFVAPRQYLPDYSLCQKLVSQNPWTDCLRDYCVMRALNLTFLGFFINRLNLRILLRKYDNAFPYFFYHQIWSECLFFDLSLYGNVCAFSQFRRCIQVLFLSTCHEWNNTGTCTDMETLARDCVEQWPVVVGKIMIILIIFVIISIPELKSYRRYKYLDVNCELLNFSLGQHRLMPNFDCCLDPRAKSNFTNLEHDETKTLYMECLRRMSLYYLNDCSRDYCVIYASNLTFFGFFLNKPALMPLLRRYDNAFPYVFSNQISSECLFWDLSTYGNVCSYTQFRRCIQVTFLSTCHEWNNTGICTDMETLARDCVEVW